MVTTTKTKVSKRFLLLVLSVIVFFGSVLIVRTAQTNGFTVNVDKVSLVTDDGARLAGTIYVPKNATAKTPAAGVLVCPGGNTPAMFYASYSIELARRGYVVFSYDYYATGASGFSTAADSGALYAMKYLSTLKIVDSNRLASTGHSNGGAQAYKAIISDYAANAKQKSVIFIGCGAQTAKLENTNVAVIWGKNDEAGTGRGWSTFDPNNMSLGAFPQLAGVDSKAVKVDTYYTTNTGAKRILYAPNTMHSLSNIVPSSVSNIVDFLDDTLGGNVTKMKSSSLVYIWQEFFTAIAAIALMVMIFPVGSYLLDCKFFGSLKVRVPERRGKMNAAFWIFLLIPLALMIWIIKWAVIYGQTLLNKVHMFRVANANGFVWWFFMCTLLILGFTFVRALIDKSMDKKAMLTHAKAAPSYIGKSVLFGLVTIGIVYFAELLCEYLFPGLYCRLFQSYFTTFNSSRIGTFIVYFVVYGILLSLFGYFQTFSLNLEKGKSWQFYVLTFICNALPAILFVGYTFMQIFITHVTPINGREMSRAVGTMLGMILLYPVMTKITTYFYKKTGSFYPGAMVNSAFAVWLAVNIQQINW